MSSRSITQKSKMSSFDVLERVHTVNARSLVLFQHPLKRVKNVPMLTRRNFAALLFALPTKLHNMKPVKIFKMETILNIIDINETNARRLIKQLMNVGIIRYSEKSDSYIISCNSMNVLQRRTAYTKNKALEAVVEYTLNDIINGTFSEVLVDSVLSWHFRNVSKNDYITSSISKFKALGLKVTEVKDWLKSQGIAAIPLKRTFNLNDKTCDKKEYSDVKMKAVFGTAFIFKAKFIELFQQNEDVINSPSGAFSAVQLFDMMNEQTVQQNTLWHYTKTWLQAFIAERVYQRVDHKEREVFDSIAQSQFDRRYVRHSILESGYMYDYKQGGFKHFTGWNHRSLADKVLCSYTTAVSVQ